MDFTKDDRDLLVRIDERQKNSNENQDILIKHFESFSIEVKKEIKRLDEEKISRKSISWFLSFLGGLFGGISTLFAIIYYVKETFLKGN